MEPTIYQICVRGRLTERLASALEGMTLRGGAVNTVFTGEIKDQSQLYGLLDRLRDRPRINQRATGDGGWQGHPTRTRLKGVLSFDRKPTPRCMSSCTISDTRRGLPATGQSEAATAQSSSATAVPVHASPLRTTSVAPAFRYF